MQVEQKTEKGTVLFVKVPDDAKVFNFYMGYLTYKVLNPKTMCGEDIMSNPYHLTKFLERTENMPEYIDAPAIKISEGFTLVGLANEINEEQAKMMVDFHIFAYKNYMSKAIYEFKNAVQSFKSLMQHLQVYESIPKRGAIDESRVGKWVVFFKEN